MKCKHNAGYTIGYICRICKKCIYTKKQIEEIEKEQKYQTIKYTGDYSNFEMKNYKAKVKKIEQHIWKCGKYGTDDWHKEAVDFILSLIREIVQEAVGEKFELKDNMTSDFRSFLDGRNYQSNIILSNVEKLLK